MLPLRPIISYIRKSPPSPYILHIACPPYLDMLHPLFKWLINTQITAATTESQPQELILQASTTQTNAKPSQPPLIIFRFRREPHLHWQLFPWIALGLPDMVRKIRMLCLVQMWGPNLQKRLATIATDGFSMANCRIFRPSIYNWTPATSVTLWKQKSERKRLTSFGANIGKVKVVM